MHHSIICYQFYSTLLWHHWRWVLFGFKLVIGIFGLAAGPLEYISSFLEVYIEL